MQYEIFFLLQIYKWSPDLSPLYFLFWGFVKERIFRTAPPNIAQLKNEVREVIASTDVNICSFLANLVVPIDKCVDSGGIVMSKVKHGIK